MIILVLEIVEFKIDGLWLMDRAFTQRIKVRMNGRNEKKYIHNFSIDKWFRPIIAIIIRRNLTTRAIHTVDVSSDDNCHKMTIGTTFAVRIQSKPIRY